MKALAFCCGSLLLLVTAQAAAGGHTYHRKRLSHPPTGSPAPAEAAAPAPAAASEQWTLTGPHWVVGLDRVASVVGFSMNVKESDDEDTLTGIDAYVLGLGPHRGLISQPRLAIDGVFAYGVTFGAAVGYSVLTSKVTDESGTSDDVPTVSSLVLAPRVGVLLYPSPTLGVWLRGGVSYVMAREASESASGSSSSATTLWGVELTLDPQLVVVVAPRVAVTLGAVLDLGLTGSVTSTHESSLGGSSSESIDLLLSDYGVIGGLAVLF